MPDVLVVQDVCREVPPACTGFSGLLGDHLQRTRANRLREIIEHPLILQGFRQKRVTYPWQAAVPFKDASWEGNHAYAWIGEHVGKWLHAAVLMGLNAGDRALIARVRSVADELVSCQEPDGYLGTYARPFRMSDPAGPHTPTSWDVWTHRYNLFGLLSAHRYLGDSGWLAACARMGDLLATTFGPGGKPIVDEGTRAGLSALTIIESVVMLYQATGDRRYLELARHFVYDSSERRTRVLSNLLARRSLTSIGSGKAYQLMAVLLGLLELYRCTGDTSLREAVLYAWETIREQHLHVTGGPWSKKVDATTNRECFAAPHHWSPAENVENCAAVIWMQLNLSLLRLTGESRFAEEVERTLYNHLLGAHHPDCRAGAYFSAPNDQARIHTIKLDCCNSSRPRALALVTTHAFTYRAGGVSVNIYAPGTARLHIEGQPVGLRVETGYPLDGRVRLVLELATPSEFSLWLRIPAWAKRCELRLNDGLVAEPAQPGSYLRLNRRWQSGDTIELQFPMELEVHLREHGGAVLASASRGPLVLAATQAAPAGPVDFGRDTAPALVPHYQAGAHNGPVTTWFSPRSAVPEE